MTPLYIIETFGTYSGLKMNKNKSELIWLGRKKHTKEILCKNSTLSWGKTDFKLLGITFSTNLEEIPTKNYEPLLKKISQVINLWKKRILTPTGKNNSIEIYYSVKVYPPVSVFTSTSRSPSQTNNKNNV